MACGYQSAPFPVPPGPSQRHSKKLSSFLAELVFDSQQGEASSRTGTKQMVEAHGTGWLGGEKTGPIGKGRQLTQSGGTEPFCGGERWRLGDAQLGLCPPALHSLWRSGVPSLWVPRRAGIAPSTVYLLAQLSAEPFSCVPSPEGVKTAFLGHKRLAYPWWRNYSWKRNATFKNHTAVKVLLNIKVGVMAAEFQRWKAESLAQLCAAGLSFPVHPS